MALLSRSVLSLLWILLVISTGSLASGEAAIAAKSVPGIPTLYKIVTMSGVVYIGSQPTPEGIAALSKLNVKTIINLSSQGETQFDEAALAAKHQMHYVSLPVGYDTVLPQQLQSFNKLLRAGKNYPIFVHCQSANRAAMMMALNNITVDKTPVNAAIQEAQQYGLINPKLITVIRHSAKRWSSGR